MSVETSADTEARPLTYCSRCLEPSTRPDSIFDDEGVCLPCRLLETADQIDWEARRRELDRIVEWARAHNVTGYDCIVPVSGGKDSHRQAMYCRDELGLHPLLVTCAYPPEQQTERGADNIANLVNLGFDCIFVSPAPETWRHLMQAGFFRWGNMFKSTELALYASAPKVATAWHIPLVVYGENPTLSWGSAGGSMNEDANQLRFSNTLQGGDISWLLEAGFDMKEIYWYRYPSDRDVRRANLRMIYLGYFMEDFNDLTNGRLAMEWGLKPRQGEDARLKDIGQITTFDALDDDFVIVNQMLKQLKFGFGKASEQCSGMIRSGVMTREEAIEMAAKYDGRCAHRYLKAFCDYIGVTEDEFWEHAEKWRNKDLWIRNGNEWTLRYPPAIDRRKAAAGLAIAVVDYGMGNLVSVANAFGRLGCRAALTDDADDIRRADAIVLPGVGGFGEAMRALRARGLEAPLSRAVLEDRASFLGICLGMQLLARRSEEHGNHDGLGWIDAEVRYIPDDTVRVPHVGWTPVSSLDGEPLFRDIEPSAAYYFDHSLHFVPTAPVVAATCTHGTELVAAIRSDNILAAQFHPEKSERTGLRLLRNFLNVCVDRRLAFLSSE